MEGGNGMLAKTLGIISLLIAVGGVYFMREATDAVSWKLPERVAKKKRSYAQLMWIAAYMVLGIAFAIK